MKLILPSPAKINLFLHVVERREDGYHNLQTAFQFLNLCDKLVFCMRSDNQIIFESNIGTSVPNEENLVWKAAKLMQNYSKKTQGIDIVLHKRIPIGGGLGGGSSNAASTLLALNFLWQINLPHEELMSLGAKLGADVPIFLFGHAAWAEERGDSLTPFKQPEKWYLVLHPSCQVSTKIIFSDADLTRNSPKMTQSEFQLKGGRNDCEPITCKHYPAVAEALTILRQHSKAKMTGTGSCLFAEFDSKSEALHIQNKLPQSFQSFVVKGKNYSPLHKSIKKFAGIYKN